ncbi:MAG TPA: helix-turn-helix transcriptional regulator [Actinomycetes bacterium]
MTSKRKVANPLALAVLGVLLERPMHPYEIGFTLRHRHKEDSIKLNYGSLYTVVDALQREGMIRAKETVREGRRPERTVYALTDAGRDEFYDWLRELLRAPVKEFPQFLAGLAQIPALLPPDAAAVLEERAVRLEAQIQERRSLWETLLRENRLPRAVLIEDEYQLAMLRAELDWVRGVVREIESGELAWSYPELEELSKRTWAEARPQREGANRSGPRAGEVRR